MKRLLTVVLASLVLITATAYASVDEFGDNTFSLIGIEGGYGSFDFEHGLVAGKKTENKSFGEGALKLGAQTDDYRLFLSARYYSISGFDYAYCTGAEAQYLMNVSNYMNIFVGFNVGVMNFKYEADTTVAKVSDKKDYYGGDIGVNLHLMEALDFEIGARYMYIGYDYTNASTTAVAKFDHMINGYASFIYRFQME
ncbi:porin family protein [bacterium]|nr:porin family protein [bacterium]MBU1883626.1 porin family protein [bacterium]